MLSIKGREPFIRMQLWLSDGNNVERLQLLKNERREASKRRRSTGPGMQDNSSDTSSNDTSEFYTSNSPGPGSVGSAGAPPNKKQRVLFSEEQKEALRLAFALDPYPNVATIEFLASELCLSTRTITNWFHNHRMRLKQQVPHGIPSDPVPSRENQSNAPFDPVQFRILLNQRLMELQKERMGLAGVPLPYPPYFAANPNLAALISRGLLSSEADLAALNAFKEQISGLDLTMGGTLKREREEYFDDDGDNEPEPEPEVDNENHDSDAEDDNNDDDKSETRDLSASAQAIQSSSRTSRRKPAAPQWVNPNATLAGRGATNADEVIINGVCVMQQSADYDRDEETVRIEPQPVQDRFDNNGRSDDDENETNQKDNADAKKINQKSNADNDDDCNDNDKSNTRDGNVSPIVKKEIEENESQWEN